MSRQLLDARLRRIESASWDRCDDTALLSEAELIGETAKVRGEIVEMFRSAGWPPAEIEDAIDVALEAKGRAVVVATFNAKIDAMRGRHNPWQGGAP